MADEWEVDGGEWDVGAGDAVSVPAVSADLEALVARHEAEGPRVGAEERPAAPVAAAPSAAARAAAAALAAQPPAVLLGFVDEPELPQHLQPYFFPSKVGGKPAWLDPLHLPSADELLCPTCNDPLVFLLQVYASLDEREDAFHRSLLLFICRRGSCLRHGAHGSLRALRAQLPRDNLFYSYWPPTDTEARAAEAKELVAGASQCAICGLLGSAKCGRCKVASYCCRRHQQLDWARHKRSCRPVGAPAAEAEAGTDGAPVPPSREARWVFPEFELAIDEEPDVEAALGSQELSHEQRMLERYRAEQREQAGSSAEGGTMGAEGGAEEDDDLGDGEDLEQLQDEAFLDFQRRISVEPEQCLRYCRHARASPLWVSRKGQPGDAVPPCARCGAPRCFEFQVMPQLLNHLQLDMLDADSLDWGTLAVYTCQASCEPRAQPQDGGAAGSAGAGGAGGDARGAAVGTHYAEEFVWRQVLNDEEGMRAVVPPGVSLAEEEAPPMETAAPAAAPP